MVAVYDLSWNIFRPLCASEYKHRNSTVCDCVSAKRLHLYSLPAHLLVHCLA